MEKDKKTVAIVGASRDHSKYGNKSIRAHLAEGWDVFPINPNGTEIENLRAYKSLDDLPVKPYRVSLYLPPEIGVSILPQVAAASPEEFFVNPGAESDELITKAKQLGLCPIVACSIVNLGHSPGEFDS